MPEVLTKQGSPDVSAIIVTDPVQITAYGLGDGDCVTFLKIQYDADRKTFARNGCSVIPPSELKVGRASDYMIGACKPSLSKCRNTIIINRPGIYQPSLKNVSAMDVAIEAEEISNGCCPGPAELGIDPCGCGCHGEPTEPLPMHEDSVCGGPQFIKMAWMYSPFDDRDSAATVKVTDCDGNIKGYIYPSAGPGHTIPVYVCTENGTSIYGFAINNSSAASQMVTYQSGSECSSSQNNHSGNNVVSGISSDQTKALIENLDALKESVVSKADKADVDKLQETVTTLTSNIKPVGDLDGKTIFKAFNPDMETK